MKDFPSCFGENAVQLSVFPSATKSPQNLVTSLYHCRFHGGNYSITLTWTKNLIGLALTIAIHNCTHRKTLCTTEIKPWLFSRNKGSKHFQPNSFKIDLFWDLSSAKFGSSPEPISTFYTALAFDNQMVLLLGDMRKEALKRSGSIPAPSPAIFVSKREHMLGKKLFATKAQFSNLGRVHDLTIECDTGTDSDSCLSFLMDGKQIMQVKRLRWKFRGNNVVLIDDVAVEVFWDVYDWLFGGSSGSGNGVFLFRTSEPAEKLWAGWWSHCDSRSLSWSSGGSQRFRDGPVQSIGFSLVLYARKSE